MIRRAALVLALAGCDDGGAVDAVDVGVPRVRPSGELVVDLDGPCRHPVLSADAEGVLRVRTPAPEDSAVEARVVDGPGRLLDGDRPARPVQAGEVRFPFACDGFGITHVFARDDQGRTAVSAEILCARPSGFARACASNVPPRPLGPFTVEQFAPTGDLGRRLAPRGRGGVGVEDQVTVKLRLVFEGGLRPETGGVIEVSVADGAPPGVEVEPARVATEPGTGEASVVLSAGEASGTFVLQYAGLLDGERVEVDSRPFVVTRPPADTVTITCAGDAAPRPWFDAAGGVRVDAEGVRCRLAATADGGPPVEGTRAWVLTEAGSTNRRPRTLEADGAVEVYVDPGRPPPRDVVPVGPSPLDALATVVGIVESTEPFDDVDGDGVFTAGVDGFDPADDVEEPYVDADDDGRYTPGEVFFDTDGDGAWSPANGVPDALALRWAATRLRWVGPLDTGPDALRLDCVPPRCFDAPVPDLHAACAGPMDAWLAEDAAVTGEARAVDRNGQCVAASGAARWFVEPPGALVLEGEPPRLGPCGLGGAAATPFRLLLKRDAQGPVRFGWRAPDGAEVARIVCAP